MHYPETHHNKIEVFCSSTHYSTAISSPSPRNPFVSFSHFFLCVCRGHVWTIGFHNRQHGMSQAVRYCTVFKMIDISLLSLRAKIIMVNGKGTGTAIGFPNWLWYQLPFAIERKFVSLTFSCSLRKVNTLFLITLKVTDFCCCSFNSDISPWVAKYIKEITFANGTSHKLSQTGSPVKTIACSVGPAWLSAFVLLKIFFTSTFLQSAHFFFFHFTLMLKLNCGVQIVLWNAGCHFNSTTTFQCTQGIQRSLNLDMSNSSNVLTACVVVQGKSDIVKIVTQQVMGRQLCVYLILSPAVLECKH